MLSIVPMYYLFKCYICACLRYVDMSVCYTCVCMYMIRMEKRLEGYTPNAKSNQHSGVELIFRFF